MRFFVLFPFASACIGSVGESDFLTEYTKEVCSQIFSCVSSEDQTIIEDFYGSEEQCATDMQTEIENSLLENELVYNPSTASECLDVLGEKKCDDQIVDDDPCNNVYTESE